ncbi:MAG: epimerase [Betaproteobacteria bacterium HGW-Betaproteobacteria-9]|jgi:putative NADH-flavin reductase|nr:MAG: epimerase [Betaproteobacteria bacterium HGW-Betaproteobacteria-9]
MISVRVDDLPHRLHAIVAACEMESEVIDVKKIVIFGSTGTTGKLLVRQALERGHEVFAFARRPADIGGKDVRLHRVQGDVMNLVDVQQAVQGMDAALSVLGVRMGQPQSNLRSVGTDHIVSALTMAGVNRFVSVSTVGAGAHLQSLPWLARLLLPHIVGSWRLEEAGRQENIISSSQLDWTILRPPRLVDGASRGDYRMGEDMSIGLGAKLARVDLARAILDQLDSNRYLRSLPTVCG